MSKRTQAHLASAALSLAIVAMAAFVLLIFYVPHVVTTWDAVGAQLTTWQRVLATASRSAVGNGPLLLTVLWMILMASVCWRIIAAVRLR